MLLAREKEILVAGQVIKLFSFDGRTWFSHAHDWKEFRQRRAVEIAVIRRQFANYVPDGSQARGRVDFW